jgi:hypothetical protein
VPESGPAAAWLCRSDDRVFAATAVAASCIITDGSGFGSASGSCVCRDADSERMCTAVGSAVARSVRLRLLPPPPPPPPPLSFARSRSAIEVAHSADMRCAVPHAVTCAKLDRACAASSAAAATFAVTTASCNIRATAAAFTSADLVALPASSSSCLSCVSSEPWLLSSWSLRETFELVAASLCVRLVSRRSRSAVIC